MATGMGLAAFPGEGLAPHAALLTDVLKNVTPAATARRERL